MGRQFFFLLFDPELVTAGRNLMDGRYGTFGRDPPRAALTLVARVSAGCRLGLVSCHRLWLVSAAACLALPLSHARRALAPRRRALGDSESLSESDSDSDSDSDGRAVKDSERRYVLVA